MARSRTARARGQVEHPPTRYDLGVLAQVPADGEPAGPRERPVGERGIRVARLYLDGMPQRQHVVSQMEFDLLKPSTGRRCVWRRTKERGEAAIAVLYRPAASVPRELVLVSAVSREGLPPRPAGAERPRPPPDLQPLDSRSQYRLASASSTIQTCGGLSTPARSITWGSDGSWANARAPSSVAKSFTTTIEFGRLPRD